MEKRRHFQGGIWDSDLDSRFNTSLSWLSQFLPWQIHALGRLALMDVVRRWKSGQLSLYALIFERLLPLIDSFVMDLRSAQRPPYILMRHATTSLFQTPGYMYVQNI
jgi:hypothetical protein